MDGHLKRLTYRSSCDWAAVGWRWDDRHLWAVVRPDYSRCWVADRWTNPKWFGTSSCRRRTRRNGPTGEPNRWPRRSPPPEWKVKSCVSLIGWLLCGCYSWDSPSQSSWIKSAEWLINWLNEGVVNNNGDKRGHGTKWRLILHWIRTKWRWRQGHAGGQQLVNKTIKTNDAKVNPSRWELKADASA